MEALLRARALQKSYGNQHVLTDVNFSLYKGEIVGLLGVNGTGKSTLMKICVNLLSKNGGSLKVLGYDPKQNWKQLYKEIRILLEPNYPGYLTGKEFLIETAILQDADVAAVDDFLEQVGLSAVSHKKITHYSFGMRQRLGLACALIGKPKLIILDEPFIGLDPNGVATLQQLLKEKAKQGITFLISSHQLEELKRIADRMLFLHEGKIQREFSKDDLNHTVTVNLKTDNNLLAWKYLTEKYSPVLSFRLQNDNIVFHAPSENQIKEIVQFLKEKNLRDIAIAKESFDLRNLFRGVEV